MSSLTAFLPLLTSLGYLALTLIGFGLLIFIHELGHFLAARRCNMRVEEFNIGFGRPLFSKEIDKVMWRIRWLPIGGYVRIAGMEDDPQQIHIPHTYYSCSLFQRAQVIFAGPLFNIVAAFALFCAIYAFGGRTAALAPFNPIIGYLDKSSELYQGGLRPGDLVRSCCQRPLGDASNFSLSSSFGKKEMVVSAEKIDYRTASATPISFTASAALDKKMTRTACDFPHAQALQIGAICPHSPCSGELMAGDRLLWADGERLFSPMQLSELINDNCALITYQRKDLIISQRIEKISLRQLREKSSPALCGNWLHWHGQNEILGERELMCLPLQLAQSNVVVSPEEGREALTDRADLPKEGGFERGDRIIAVDGCPVSSPSQIAALLLTKHVAIIIERPSALLKGGQRDPLLLSDALRAFNTPLFSKELSALERRVGSGPAVDGAYQLLKPMEVPKVSFADVPARRLLGIQPFDATIRDNSSPIKKLLDGIIEPLRALRSLFGGSLQRQALAGPIGMAQVIYQSWSVSVIRVLDLLAIISLNLAVLNLLPLPVLDGGHLLFALLEGARGKPLKAQTMQRLTTFFLLAFALLGLFIAFTDIERLIRGWIFKA